MPAAGRATVKACPAPGWRNLGPRSRAWLSQIGVQTPEALASLGAVPAYLALEARGVAVSLNLLWALAGAIEGRDWRELARQDRPELLAHLAAAREAARFGGQQLP